MESQHASVLDPFEGDWFDEGLPKEFTLPDLSIPKPSPWFGNKATFAHGCKFKFLPTPANAMVVNMDAHSDTSFSYNGNQVRRLGSMPTLLGSTSQQADHALDHSVPESGFNPNFYFSKQNHPNLVPDSIEFALLGSDIGPFSSMSQSPLSPSLSSASSLVDQVDQIRTMKSPCLENHGELYMCNTCRKTFPNTHALGGHMSSHTRAWKKDTMTGYLLKKPYNCVHSPPLPPSLNFYYNLGVSTNIAGSSANGLSIGTTERKREFPGEWFQVPVKKASFARFHENN